MLLHMLPAAGRAVWKKKAPMPLRPSSTSVEMNSVRVSVDSHYSYHHHV